MKKRIEISLCRVSASGKYLDIICNAPRNSEFVSMYITTEHLEGGEFVTQEFEIQDAFTDPAKRSYTFKLPVSKFNLEGIPAIYQIKLTAEDLEIVKEQYEILAKEMLKETIKELKKYNDRK